MPRFTHPSQRRDGSQNLQKGLPSTSITAYRPTQIPFIVQHLILFLSLYDAWFTYVKFRVSPDCRGRRLVKLVGVVRT